MPNRFSEDELKRAGFYKKPDGSWTRKKQTKKAKPTKIVRKALEAEVQKAFFQWVALQAKQDWRYLNIMATPNQGGFDPRWGKIRLAEGMSPGFPDISVLVPKEPYHGLFIELKTARGRVRDTQQEWIDRLVAMQYKAIIVKTDHWEELRDIVQDWMS